MPEDYLEVRKGAPPRFVHWPGKGSSL
jgi:hypothetical protein